MLMVGFGLGAGFCLLLGLAVWFIEKEERDE